MQQIARGGYVLKDGGGKPDVILIATGSEMEITLLAAEKLTGEGRNVRVVSLPSTDIFDAQDETYRESVLPANVSARVAVEAGIVRLLVQICWAERGDCWDDGLWGVGAGRQAVPVLRLYGR